MGEIIVMVISGLIVLVASCSACYLKGWDDGRDWFAARVWDTADNQNRRFIDKYRPGGEHDRKIKGR